MAEEIVTRRRVLRGEDELAETPAVVSPISWVANLVYSLSGILEAILALRFVLRLLAANPGNQFVNGVYNLTQPFVTPFFGIFGTPTTTFPGRFEVETLVAMVVYALVAYIVVSAFRLFRF